MELIRKYSPSLMNNNAICNDDLFKKLVTKTFRNRVVDHISLHEDEFKDFAKDDVGHSFDAYVNNMRISSTYGDELEIRAMSEMLAATIHVFSGGRKNHPYGSGNIQIRLFHVSLSGDANQPNHYQFELDENIIEDFQRSTASQAGSTNQQATLAAQPSNSQLSLKRNEEIRDGLPPAKKPKADIELQPNYLKDANLQENAKNRKRLHSSDSQDEIAPSKKLTTFSNKPNTYAASGLKHTLHGNIYQLKLLILFLKRGLDKGYTFRLATEMDAAEKFDDLVFQYENDQKDGVIYRFLQAKHKLDKTKKISANDLLTETDGEFSLHKYFISYCKIKKNPEFSKGEFQDFIICSNIGFNEDDLRNERINLEKLTETDDFFEVTTNGPSKIPACYQLVIDSQSKTYQILRETSETYRLAKILLEHVYKKKPIDLKVAIFKSYHVALAQNIIDVKNKKFHDHFIKDENLSNSAAKFRAILEMVIKQKKQLTKNSDLWIDLAKQELKLSGTFGNGIGTLDLPDDEVSDQEIEGFFKKLVFAVNQPNEIEVGKIIQSEIGNEFNLIDSDLIAGYIQREMLDWFKEKGKEKGHEGKFLSNQDGKAFFAWARQKVNSLISIGSSLQYQAKIKEYNISFNRESLQMLYNFFLQKTQVYLLSSEQTLLSAIKVYQTLTELLHYQEDDSFIFIKLSSLLRKEIQERLVDAFKSSASHNLLVIVCNVVKGDVQNLYNILIQIIKDNVNKKIVLIAQQNHELAEKLKTQQQFQYVEEADKINFSHLTSESQRKLLCSKVIFQGYQLELQELVDSENAWNELIDLNTLNKLVAAQTIEIGSEPMRLSNLDAAYARSYKEVPPQNLANALLEEAKVPTGMLFMVSGITPKDDSSDVFVQLLGIIDKNHVHDIKKNIEFLADANNWIQTDFSNQKMILIVSGQNEEINLCVFKKLCHDNSKKIVHWINIVNGQFHLQELYDPDFYISRRLYYRKKIVITQNNSTHNIQKFLLNDDPSDLFVFSEINPESIAKLLNTDKYIEDKIASLDINRRAAEREKMRANLCKNIFASFDRSEVEKKFKEWHHFYKKPVHWLEVQDTQLVWQYSCVSIENLRKLIDEENIQQDELDESYFTISINDKVVLLAAEPGMGKSTTLTRLSERKLQTFWVIRLNLKDCQRAIDNLSKTQNCTIDGVIKFLLLVNNANFEQPLTQSLLRYTLKHVTSRLLLILFDGFDEIKAEHQDMIIPLLQFLKEETPARVWITTRLHKMQKLEYKLAVFATTFKELLLAERKAFLRNFWRVRLKLDLSPDDYHKIFEVQESKTSDRIQSKFEQFADALLGKADGILNETVSRFMGIPLQMRLLAEGFQPEFEKFIQSLEDLEVPNFNTIDVPDIYQRFLRVKYDIYFKEKTGLSVGFSKVSKEWFTELLTKRHQRLAFQVLFPNEVKGMLQVKSPFLDDNDSFVINSEEEIELKRVGIIHSTQHNSKFEFIHRTFAEYFTANLLVHWLKKSDNHPLHSQVQELLLKRILIEPVYQVVRLFFEGKLAQTKLPESTFIYYSKKVVKLVPKTKNWRDRNPVNTTLHIAAKEGHAQIIGFLLDCAFKKNPDSLKNLLLAKDGLRRRPLQLAIRNNKPEAIGCLLSYVKDNSYLQDNYETLEKLMSNEDKDIFYYDDRDEKVVQVLLRCLRNYPKICEPFIAGKNLERLLEIVQDDPEMQMFLKNSLSIDDNQEKSQSRLLDCKEAASYLYKTVKKGDIVAAQKCLDQVSDYSEIHQLLIVTHLGKTVFQIAIENEHTEVVELMLNRARDYPGILQHFIMIINKNNNITKEYQILCIRLLLQSVQHDPEMSELLWALQNRLNLHVVNNDEGMPQLADNDEDKANSLHVAAREGDIQAVQESLDKMKANPNTLQAIMLATDENHSTALHLACMHGHDIVVKQLLDSVQDDIQTLGTLLLLVSTKYYNGTALHIAVRNGYVKVIQHLLNSVKNHHGIFQQLILATTSAKYGKTALHLTTKESIAKQLIDFSKESFPEATYTLAIAIDKSGETPFHHAAQKGYATVIQSLLDCAQNYPTIIKYLILAKGKSGKTALYLAMEKRKLGTLSVMLQRLENYGDLRRQAVLEHLVANDDEKMNLYMAAERSKEGTTRAFLNQLKNFNDIFKQFVLPDNEGSEPALYKAVKNGHKQIVDAFLDSLKDYSNGLWKLVSWVDKKNLKSALHLAVEKGYREIVATLLNSLKDQLENLKDFILMKDSSGNIALNYAINNNRQVMVDTFVAILNDNIDIIYELLLAGDNFDSTNKNHNERIKIVLNALQNHSSTLHKLLIWAIDKDDVFIIKAIVETDPTVLKNIDLDKYVLSAAQQDRSDLVEQLVNMGANINTQDNSGDTPLMWAARNGNLKMVEYLVSIGADIRASNNNRVTSLQFANEEHKLDAVKYLVDKLEEAINIVGAPRLNDIEFLQEAISDDKLDIIICFMEKGNNVNVADSDDVTLLHKAVEHRKLKIVKYLIDKGAKIDTVDKGGQSPLRIAIKKEYQDVVKVLLQNADINTVTSNGGTLLHWAVRYDFQDVVADLLTKGANINAKDYDGLAPLHIAVHHGLKNIVETLLKHGADVLAKDKCGITVLHRVVHFNDEQVIELILSKIKKKFQQDTQQIAKWINAHDDQRNTPLHLAADRVNQEAVKLLLASSAAANIRNLSQKTPLDLLKDKLAQNVEDQGHIRVIEVLLLDALKSADDLHSEHALD